MCDEERLPSNGSAPRRRYGIGETHVSPCANGWLVEQSGASEAGRRYDTEAEAIAAARRLTRPEGGRIVIHGPDGPVRGGLILGRLAFDRLSAVEGIRLSPAMDRDLRVLDETGLSDEERRRVLTEKYGRMRER